MDLFHKLIDLVDKNSSMIPEGDYLELCDTIKQLRDKVKPPSFLNQSIPMWMHDETAQVPLTYEPTTVDVEDRYPGLNEFIQQLDAEWAATDNTGPVEPGAYYPPMQDGNTSLSE